MENIYTCAEPFLVLMKFFGLFPMSFEDAAAKGKLRVKLQNFIFLVFGFFLLVGVTCCNIFRDRVFVPSSKILPRAYEICLMLGLLNLFLLFFYQMSQFRSIERFLHLLDTFDHEARSIEIYKMLFLISLNFNMLLLGKIFKWQIRL